MVGNFELTEIEANDLPIETRKKIAIYNLFPDVSKEQFVALSSYIDGDLQKFNICDMNMQNISFKNMVEKLGLASPGKKAFVITPYMLKLTFDYNKPAQIISNSFA